MMKSKAVVVALALALVVCAMRPSRAEASDVAIWVGVGIASYVVLLAGATMLAFPHPAPLAPDLAELPPKEPDKDVVRFGGRCRQSGPSFVVACW